MTTCPWHFRVLASTSIAVTRDQCHNQDTATMNNTTTISTAPSPNGKDDVWGEDNHSSSFDGWTCEQRKWVTNAR